jgi:hypothetical protein
MFSTENDKPLFFDRLDEKLFAALSEIIHRQHQLTELESSQKPIDKRGVAVKLPSA